MNDYPAHLVEVNHVEPVPRRIRAYLNGEKVLDTTGARYVWELPYYPQYYIPVSDVRRDLLVPEGQAQQTGRGVAEVHGLRVGDVHHPRAAKLITESAIGGLPGTVRFDWGALDAWFEEDEQVFVHPRNPYSRVDAVRSDRARRGVISCCGSNNGVEMRHLATAILAMMLFAVGSDEAAADDPTILACRDREDPSVGATLVFDLARKQLVSSSGVGDTILFNDHHVPVRVSPAAIEWEVAHNTYTLNRATLELDVLGRVYLCQIAKKQL